MKKEIRNNYRIIVEPKRIGDLGCISFSDRMLYSEEDVPKEYEKRCKEIVEDIKRHVNNVDWCEIDYDKEFKCSFCGYDWDEDENGQPLCCEEAIEEFKKLKLINNG